MTAPQQLDPNDWLMSGGARSAKFPEVGTIVKGTITTPPTLSQQTDFTTGALKTWDDGKPMMQLIVTIATDEKDDVEDDGLRSLYVKGAMQAAVKDAIRKAGARGLEVGGTIAVKYTGDGVAKQRGMNPPKQFAAQYVAPTAKAVDDFLATPEPASAAPAASKPVDTDPPF
ncbi:MAG: hypothetical protein ACXV2H_09310 [Actinomycetes bacterium]